MRDREGSLASRSQLLAQRALDREGGHTVTYGELATRSGTPGAARAVGSVMARNRVPVVIPCHRVVAAGGMGGFSAPNGLQLKQRMLNLEKIAALSQPRRED